MSRRPASRFLAPAARAGNGTGYLAQPLRQLPEVADERHVVDAVAAAVAMCDEPESIGGAILDSFGADARHFQSVRHSRIVQTAREHRAGMSAEARLADAHARAKAQHRTDLRGEFLALEKAVDRARRGQLRRVVERADGFLESEPVALKLTAAALERLERVEAALDRLPDAIAA